MMINLLFFIEKLSGGGAEKVLRNLVNNMDQSKFNITVQTIDQEDPGEYLVPGIHYKAVNKCRTTFGKKLFSYWFRLCAELKLAYPLFVKGDYDIEIAYLETVATKIIAQSTNHKAVKLAWVHCDLSKKEGMVAAADKLRKQYQLYDKIICVSQDAQIGFRKLFGNAFDTLVLDNVIDEEEILKKAEETVEWDNIPDRKRLLAVGRLTHQKNFSHLLDTCAKLRDAGYQFQLAILGEGPEREKLEYQIQELHLEEMVELKGFCTNPYPYISKADVVVCSSLYEGISTVVQEALILGRPVVTTPCTGMIELLGDSTYGLIAEDTSNGLYQSLSVMLNSKAMLEEYTKKAKKRGTYFLKKRVVGETETLFIQLCKNISTGGYQ